MRYFWCELAIVSAFMITFAVEILEQWLITKI